MPNRMPCSRIPPTPVSSNLRRRAGLLGVCLGVLTIAAGCATTRFEETWRAPGFQPGSYKRVLVVGVGKKAMNVRRLERAFAARIAAHGAKARMGSPLKTGPDPWTEANLRRAVADQNVDAVLLSRLRYTDTTEKRAPHAVAITGSSYDYYGYYVQSVTLADSPQPMRHTIAVVETKLFDAATGDPVWSGKTQTSLDRGITEKLIADFAKAVTAEMYGDR